MVFNKSPRAQRKASVILERSESPKESLSTNNLERYPRGFRIKGINSSIRIRFLFIILKNFFLIKKTASVIYQILVNSERLEGSLSTIYLERSMCLMLLFSTNQLELIERLTLWFSTNHLERSERLQLSSRDANHLERGLRNLCQPTTSSEGKGLRDLGQRFSSSKARGFCYSLLRSR